MFLLGLILCYLSVTTYATLGFYLTRAQQIMEVYDKTTDYGLYPTPLFPPTFQFLVFVLIPVAFFGYVPTLFLLGRGSPVYVPAALALAFVFFVINQWAWKVSLKHYSSASS